MTYVTREEMKHTLELTGLTFADLDIDQAIAAASIGIDKYVDRSFGTSGGTEVRYFTPVRGGWIQIDDLVTCATFESDSDGDGVYETTWTEGTDFRLAPFNAAAKGEPYERVTVMRTATKRFYSYPGSVKITGTWGWPEIPAPVKQATQIIAERLMRRARDAPFGVVAVGIDAGGMQIPKLDPDMRFLLEEYMRDDVLAD